MSYSFSVQTKTKELALEQVAAKLDEVVAAQPIHSHDRQQASEAVACFLTVLPDNVDGKDFCVNVNGSVSWTGIQGGEDPVVITNASISVYCSLIDAAVDEASPGADASAAA